VVKSAQAGALGAAMHGAVAAGPEAGGYSDIFTAAAKMGGIKDKRYCPIPEHVAIYDQLYAEYSKLYDYFGRGENDVMKRLRELRRTVLAG
jgi:L-ribulokinase